MGFNLSFKRKEKTDSNNNNNNNNDKPNDGNVITSDSISEYNSNLSNIETEVDALEKKKKQNRKNFWSIGATGAGLFSDGYVNNSISATNTCLKRLYPKEYANSNAISNVSAIAFVGTVVGQLTFGFLSDYHSRKSGMICACIILIVFSILCAGAWGKDGSIYGMLAALTAYRFFLGIGIGAEYPAGSVACAESSAEYNKHTQNRWFILFTNFMIDLGFVVSSFVPLVCVWIFGQHNLNPVWRVTLGLGAIPPLSLFYFRLKIDDSQLFKKNQIKRSKIPYLLIIKFYWWRLLLISLLWWIYDFSAYAFGIYSSSILVGLVKGNSIIKSFGWTTVINLFYIPGSFLGAFASDAWGPRYTFAVGVIAQAIIGFIMAGVIAQLKNHVGGFVVVYGVFLACGEFGPGDNVGLLASKMSASAVRGQFYGIAAAIGKIGAFVGTYVFPIIQKNAGGEDTVKGLQNPFWVASSLCVFSGIIAATLLPKMNADSVANEEIRFREYLAANGFDVSLIGVPQSPSVSDEEGAGVLGNKESPDISQEVVHTKNSSSMYDEKS